MEIIFCAGGNRRFAEIAKNAGFLLGAQLPDTIYFPIQFADQNWKKPDREGYMKALATHKPKMASVLDLERYEQLTEVLSWAENAAQFSEIIMIIPKAFGIIAHLPRLIGGKSIRLGYSVPTKHGGTEVPFCEFAGWPVHLLGGSPQVQMKLIHHMDVHSADGNMMMKMATQYCAFFDPHKTTKRGFWPSLSDYDGKKWEGAGPEEAFTRSCKNIMAAWMNL